MTSQNLALDGPKNMECMKHERKTRFCILWSQTSRLIFKDSAIDRGGGCPSWRGFKFETGDLQKMKTRLLMKRSDFVISNWSRRCFERDVVNFKILVARYEGCFACNWSARQTCIGIFVTNHLCPSRLLLSSSPCHHHHHHRNHHHFLAYTRPQQFSTLVLGSPQSPSWQFVMVHAIFLCQSFWVS